MKVNTAGSPKHAPDSAEITSILKNENELLKTQNLKLMAELEELKMQNQVLKEQLEAVEETGNSPVSLNELVSVFQGFLPFDAKAFGEVNTAIIESEFAQQVFSIEDIESEHIGDFLEGILELDKALNGVETDSPILQIDTIVEDGETE
ncbi:hypothetical protein FZC84_21600 [Rossellomorea vietnamensis]|uniref:Uncharacterized protein n=1 Tax=Rossellomorea vietnamensis TaxID=218284 RepID=A0A5D4M1Y2_9BACI|nr:MULTISPECIES: hypothetical protein [Bacillaceae]TYR95353.1 hypothetical protein FZC84_21600 [Rossellomorea vietnamensis]